MVVVGGVTRLTHSGLSIVEWKPIVGTIPPLSQQDWGEVFRKYQQTPEYHQVNKGMSLDEFKGIFWWEYFHRLLGRLIGAVFFIPLLYFIARRRIDRALAPRLLGIFILGGLQGAIGWWMVKSGLVDDPRVSQFRLTIHLGMAFLIFGAMFWTALGLLRPREKAIQPIARHAAGLSLLIFIMVLSGGMVAGIRAGYAYNTFPLMNGTFLPPETFSLDPWWKNFLYNMAAVQWVHRAIAWSLVVLIPWFWWRSRSFAMASSARLACHLFLAMLAIQLALGISTLLLRVPITLAAAHQAGAMLLFTLSLWVSSALRSTPRP